MDKMKIIILLLLIVTNISCNNSIQTDSAIVFIPGWKEGETKIVNSIYKVIQSNDYDSSIVMIENSYKINVDEVSQEGFILSIELLKSEINSYPELVEIDEFFQEYNELSQGVIFKLKFDIKGHYKDFINWKDVRDYFYNITDTIAFRIKSGEIPANTNINEEIINEVKLDYSTKENLSAKLLKTILSYFDIYYLELHPNETKKEYLPILSKTDSVYYLRKNEYKETKDELHLRTYTLTDSSQIKKLNAIILNNKLYWRAAEILDAYMNTLEENEYFINRKNYWINYQRTVSHYDNTSIIQEYSSP